MQDKIPGPPPRGFCCDLAPATEATISTRRLLIFTGKGGCGKSALASAMALDAARNGRRVLLVEAALRGDHPGRLHALFGVPPLPSDPVRLERGLWGVRIEAEAALRSYVLRRVRFEALYRAVFDRPSVRRTVAFFPGLRELMVLWQLRAFEQEERKNRPRFDLIVFDAPSTGLVLFLLQLPQVVVQILKTGVFARDAADIYALLADPSRTQILIATLPEELPVLEARDLWQRLQSLPSPASAGIVVNGLLGGIRDVGPLPGPRSARLRTDPALSAIEGAAGAEAMRAVLHANRILLRKQDSFARHLGTLASTRAPIWTLPFITPEAGNEAALTPLLAEALRAAGLDAAIEAPA
ncbi:MAG: ArsA family ATPase [Deltaproteobacteria bacterium]|nr:ArsA family ATPase [Deltaproteobacteria bacterium]